MREIVYREDTNGSPTPCHKGKGVNLAHSQAQQAGNTKKQFANSSNITNKKLVGECAET